MDRQQIRKALDKLDAENDSNYDEIIDDITHNIKYFDDMNYKFRYKYYDVWEEDGEIFVDYVTQEDSEMEGKEDLKNLLASVVTDDYNELTYGDNVNVYLYYNVRDNDRAGERNYRTKKGYEPVRFK